MAETALLLLIVIGLARVACQTARPGGLQGGHRRGGMAFVAGSMCINRRRVCPDDALGSVARGAVQPRGMVVVVASGAGRDRLCGLESDRRAVTLGAGHVGMPRVLELDRPVAW